MATTLYKGFNTQGQSKKFRMTDVDLVKQDLLNHFSIRKGEKLMNPNFGTIIWSTLFEPLTDALRQAIVNDIENIVNYDPRIALTNIKIDEQDYGIQILIDLVYIPSNQATNLSLQFDANSQKLTTTSSPS